MLSNIVKIDPPTKITKCAYIHIVKICENCVYAKSFKQNEFMKKGGKEVKIIRKENVIDEALTYRSTGIDRIL